MTARTAPAVGATITSWRTTYQQLLTSADERADALRRALLCLLTAAAAQGLFLACLYPLFRAVLAGSDSGDYRQAWVWLLALTGIMVVTTWLRWLGQGFDYNGDMVQTAHALRTRLGAQLRRMPLLKLQARRAGEVHATLLGNVDENLMYTLLIVNAIFMALITPFVAALVTLAVDWRLGVLMLLIFPAIVPLYRWRRPAFARGMRLLDAANRRTSADVLEYVQGLPVMRAARCEGAKAQTLQDSFAQLQRIQTLGQQKGSKPSILIATVVEIGLLAVTLVGAWWVGQGSLALSVLAAAIVMMVRFAEPLANFISFTAIMEMIETALNQVQALLATAPLPQAAPTTCPQRFDLRLENVCFTYGSSDSEHSDDPDQPPALQDVGAHIPARSLTAVVGPSGSGKSTLTRLLLRHFDPDAGTITLGGVDLRQIPEQTLNSLMAIVFQDVYLFDDTVLANIQMARPDATETEVRQAADMAQCSDFIARLPQGWHTRLGEIGARLSGGERQRISIARALLKNAPIIILDEPTAALDTQSELAVQAAIDTLVCEKTVIVIAHRLSTIACADQILVLDDGRLVEQGRHADLLRIPTGRYHRMWAAQQRIKQWHVGELLASQSPGK